MYMYMCVCVCVCAKPNLYLHLERKACENKWAATVYLSNGQSLIIDMMFSGSW